MKIWRNGFFILFIISTAFLLWFFFSTNGSNENCPPFCLGPEEETSLVVWLSLITSVTSLVGVISTAVLSWRKDQREALSTELSLAQQQVSLEREKLALEKERMAQEKRADDDQP